MFRLGVFLFIRFVMFEKEFGFSLEDLVEGKVKFGFFGILR